MKLYNFSPSRTVFQIYCMVNMLLLFLNFIRTFFAFKAGEKFGSLLFFKLLTSIFAYESMSRAFLAYWGCFKRKFGKMPEFLQGLNWSRRWICNFPKKRFQVVHWIKILNPNRANLKKYKAIKSTLHLTKEMSFFIFFSGVPNIFLSLEKICFSDGIIPYESSLKTTMHSFLILTVAISGFNVGLTAYGLFGPNSGKYDAYTGKLETDFFLILKNCYFICMSSWNKNSFPIYISLSDLPNLHV